MSRGVRRPWLQRLAGPALAVCATLVSLACVEVVLRLMGDPLRREGTFHAGRIVDGERHHAFYRYDERLGFRPPASSRFTSAKWVWGELAYDVTYSIDAHHRRFDPSAPDGPAREFALFFGGSYTFGEGVEDDETLAARYQRESEGVRAYNYGVPGYGPTQMLEHLRSPGFRGEIPEPDGRAFYLYIDHHVSRVIGGLYTYASWARDFPNYELRDGELVRNGSFTTGRPFRSFVYRLLGSSRLVMTIPIDWPYPRREEHFELTARVIVASRDAYREVFGNDRFTVVLYPHSITRDRLLPYLDEAGVRVLDYTEAFDGLGPREEFRLLELHPSARAYQVLARRLARDAHGSDLHVAQSAPSTTPASASPPSTSVAQ